MGYKFPATIIVLLLLGMGVFFYAMRPLAQPTLDLLAPTSDTEPSSDTVDGELPGAATTPTPSGSVPEGAQRYGVTPQNGSAEFRISEVLRGEPKVVVGMTSQVEGAVVLHLENPSESSVGAFRINARTFKTDAEKRDNAIGRFILKSEDAANEFIVFMPTSVEGLPATITPDTAFDLTISGNLTIAGVTHPATFHASVTSTSAGTLRADARATINRADFNLVIPDVSFVADVGETVDLSIRFDAQP